MPITTRYEHDHWERSEGEAVVHLQRANIRVEAIELDLDSLWDAGFPSFSFLIYALARFAAEYPTNVSTIYTYETPSTNRNYFHNAVFFCVVGSRSQDLLATIMSALRHQTGVPEDAIPEAVRESTSTVSAWDSPDFIDISDCVPVFHIEDGFAWRLYDAGTWFTKPNWFMEA